MNSGIARNGDVEIAYEDFGTPGGKPLLLISGLDEQMVSSWPDGFCRALADAGLHVVRYDNRDSGLSTHFTGRKQAYAEADMVEDMMAVLDALGWDTANLVGLSMGGGLAQYAAMWHPERIRTLAAISSIPQDGDLARLMLRYMRLFPGPFKLAFRRYGQSPEEQQRMLRDVLHLTEAKSLPLEQDWVREAAAESFRRHRPDRHARTRQIAAGRGVRRPPGGISRITAPVLVLSGDEDPLVKPTAGPKLAEIVANGRFVSIPRMGHKFAAPLWPRLVAEIVRHVV
ncbi:alpha/beta hydrolase [Actinospica durhamensis]|uniref:Alpha/beta hydrolase n=1 Tax=Actinospica durhamensis TaxID=1508375 RepID=A0A941EJZ1_9ACTN|nr:alpha/beta hydrolase [Actinospica durhamensis]MBR7831753.1 alpha/beta hydrolase [Actinospica durhamensis]